MADVYQQNQLHQDVPDNGGNGAAIAEAHGDNVVAIVDNGVANDVADGDNGAALVDNGVANVANGDNGAAVVDNGVANDVAIGNNGAAIVDNGVANGDNGVANGDEFPQEQPEPEPEPSPLGDVVTMESSHPTLRSVFFRGVYLCRVEVYKLAVTFSSQPLGHHALDAICFALSVLHDMLTCASDKALGVQPKMWYMLMPIALFMKYTRTGIELAEKYLDIHLPGNQELIDSLNALRTKLQKIKENAADVPGADVDVQVVFSIDDAPLPTGERARSPSSSESSLSDDEDLGSLSDEEPAQPETPGDRSMYFSIEQLKEQEEEAAEEDIEKDDKLAKLEYTDKEEKPGEELPTSPAEEAGAEAATSEHPEVTVPTEWLATVEEAERAVMGALPPPPDQPATSQDLLAAEGSSHAQPTTSKPEQKRSSKSAAATFFLTLFQAKLG